MSEVAEMLSGNTENSVQGELPLVTSQDYGLYLNSGNSVS